MGPQVISELPVDPPVGQSWWDPDYKEILCSFFGWIFAHDTNV